MVDVDRSSAASVSPYGPNGDGISGYLFAEMYHVVAYEYAYFDAIPGSYADATFTAEYVTVNGPASLVDANFQTVPEPSVEDVGTGAADKHVEAAASVERVGARPANQLVFAGPTLEEVGSGAAPGFCENARRIVVKKKGDIALVRREPV